MRQINGWKIEFENGFENVEIELVNRQSAVEMGVILSMNDYPCTIFAPNGKKMGESKNGQLSTYDSNW